MNIAEIKKVDIANGTGVRVSVFVSGCRHGCKGCFNEVAWSFSYGKPYTDEVEKEILDALKPSYIAGLTLLGGEPFEPENQQPLLSLVKKVRQLYPDKNIWAYTGFTLEELLGGKTRAATPYCLELLSNIDILVDGRFILEKKNISLAFRGSENQRILNLKELDIPLSSGEKN